MHSANIGNGSTILDMGCGYGRNSEYFAKLGALVDAVNTDKKELDYAKAHSGGLVNYVLADAADLPFPDCRYDAVLDAGCSHMCNAEMQKRIAHECARVLKLGGCLMYFGFSKTHPKYLANLSKNPNFSDPQFRDLEDIIELYGNDFDISKVKSHRWDTKGGYGWHEGLIIEMKRKLV